MPKPAAKEALLASARAERGKLEAILVPLDDDACARAGALGDWSVRDVLGHLIEWEEMVLRWIAASERGETPPVPGAGYTWGQLPALNEQIRAAWADRPLAEVRRRFVTSHAAILAAIEASSDERLFTPGLWRWMNRNTLAAYFTSATASHYRWAATGLRRGLRPQD